MLVLSRGKGSCHPPFHLETCILVRGIRRLFCFSKRCARYVAIGKASHSLRPCAPLLPDLSRRSELSKHARACSIVQTRQAKSPELC